MNKNVAVNIVFNTKTGQIVSATSDLDRLSSATNKASSSAQQGSGAFNSFSTSISKLAGVAGVALGLAALTSAIKNQISEGVKLNAEYEALQNRLASMVYINTQNTSSTGKLLSAQEKWALSSKEAKEHLDDLKDAATEMGVETGALADAYSAFASGATKQMNFKQMKESFLAISTAATSAGKDVNSLVMGMDNLAQGSVVAGSELGLFLNSIGLSNDVLKEAIAQGQLYEVIMEKTAPSVEAARLANDTFSKSVSRLKSAWQSLQQDATSKFFESLKQSLNETTALINSIKDSAVFAFEFLIQKAGACWSAFKEIFSALGEALGALISGIKSLFGEATSQMSAFEFCLRSVGSLMDMVAYAFKSLANAIKAIVLSIQGALNGLQTAYYNTKEFFGLADKDDEAKMKKLVENRKQLANDLKEVHNKQMQDTITTYKELQKTWSPQEKTDASNNELGFDFGALTQKFEKMGTAQQGALKTTKAQIDTLKSWWDNEFLLREKNIQLMKEGKQKELAAEQLRFDRVISNLNFEIQKKLQSGEITQAQALELYAVEEKLHEQKMKQIREYSETYENLRRNINSALEENIGNALNGKFENFSSIFTDMFSSVQESITKGFATSLAQAFMDSQVMEAFNKTLSGAIDGLTGKGGAEGGIFGSFLGGGGGEAGATGGLASSLGSALGGFALGAGAGGLVAGILGDSSNKNKASNYAMAGAGAGAAIGSFIPVIGTVIGGIIGGVAGALVGTFSSRKKETTAQGVQLWDKATKDSISAAEFADIKETKKKFWGMSKSTSHWTEYYSADAQTLRNIRSTLRSYEYLLEDIGGGVKEISVAAGRYSNYAHIANAGAHSLINAFLSGLNIDMNAVYSVWGDYARSVNKEVSVALGESLQKYIDVGNSFESWKLEFEGKSAEALKFQANLAQKQVDRLLETLGASDITIDNYLSYREEALKQSFDPQTIEQINSLGEYLMSAADATKKYEDALKDETKTKLNLIDPYLSKVKKFDEATNLQNDTQEKLSVQILSTLKQMLRVSQENLDEAEQTRKVLARA